MRDTFNKILQNLHIEHFEVSPKKKLKDLHIWKASHVHWMVDNIVKHVKTPESDLQI